VLATDVAAFVVTTGGHDDLCVGVGCGVNVAVAVGLVVCVAVAVGGTRVDVAVGCFGVAPGIGC